MLPGFDGLEVCRRVQAERVVPARDIPWYAANVDLTRGRRTLHDHPLEPAAADCSLLR